MFNVILVITGFYIDLPGYLDIKFEHKQPTNLDEIEINTPTIVLSSVVNPNELLYSPLATINDIDGTEKQMIDYAQLLNIMDNTFTQSYDEYEVSINSTGQVNIIKQTNLISSAHGVIASLSSSLEFKI